MEFIFSEDGNILEALRKLATTCFVLLSIAVYICLLATRALIEAYQGQMMSFFKVESESQSSLF